MMQLQFEDTKYNSSCSGALAFVSPAHLPGKVEGELFQGRGISLFPTESCPGTAMSGEFWGEVLTFS